MKLKFRNRNPVVQEFESVVLSRIIPGLNKRKFKKPEPRLCFLRIEYREIRRSCRTVGENLSKDLGCDPDRLGPLSL